MLGGGSNTLPGPFCWSDGPIRLLEVWFGPDLQLERNWSEVHAKVNARVGIWLSRRLSLKGRAEACATYVFPLILYRLAVLPLPKAHRVFSTRKTVGLQYYRRGEGRETKRGISLFFVYVFRGFFSHSHHIHCKKSYIVNKNMHDFRVLSRTFS